MAAFNFRRRRTRRWWYTGATLVAAAFFAVFFVTGAGAVLGPGNFESADGNMTVDGGSSYHDWANVAFTHVVDPAATTSDNSWVNGQKMDTACAQLSTNKNPAKDDFTDIASYSQTSSDYHLYLYGATIRVAANGNASENVELNQVPGTTACPIVRTAGDKLLAFDYLNGGTTLDLHVLTWIDSTDPTAGGNNGTCNVKHDSMPCWGAAVIVPGSGVYEGEASQQTILSANDPIGNAPDSTNSSLFSVQQGQDLAAGQFAEFGVNLTDAFNQTPGSCTAFAQTDWESRSSGSSFSSNPEDIAIEQKTVANCGQIIIRKKTSPSPDTYNSDFSFSDNIANSSGETFTLKNGGSKNFGSSILAGSYMVSETPTPGYTLTGIDCSNSSTPGGSTVSYLPTTGDGSSFTAGATELDIALKAGDTIDCTYTNTLNTDSFGTQASTNSTVLPGKTEVTDRATAKRLTGASTLTPSGNVTFYLCGPSATALSGCSSTDTQVGTTSVALGGSGDTATATSDAVNTSSDALAVGYYCFGATWSGDSNFLDLPKSETGDSSHECFQVVKDDTTTATTPWSTGDNTGGKVTSILLGGTVYDKAVVTGTDRGGVPTGTVTFYECGPLTSGNCNTGGTPVGSAGVSLGAPTTATTATAFSAGFTPTEAGTYCFRAEYGGSDVYNGSSDPSDTSSTTECFDVTQIGTTTTTTPSVGQNGTTTFGDKTVTDNAFVQADSTGGGTPTGTVTFYICDPSTVSSNGGTCSSAVGTQVGDPIDLAAVTVAPIPSPPAATADSAAFTNGGHGVNKLGTWCWAAVYTPGPPNGNNYTGSHDSAKTECFTVTDTTSSTSNQSWVPNDTATVTSTNGAPLNGTLTVQLYTGTNCSTPALDGAGDPYIYTKTVSGNTADDSISLTTANSDVFNSDVSWEVTFSSSDDHVTNPLPHCESSSLTVNDNP